MSLQLADIDAVLKEVVPDAVYNQLSNINLLFQKVKSNTSMIDTNNNIYIPVRYGRHSGVYTVSEGDNPRTGKAKRTRMQASVKYAFGTLEITDQTLEAARRADKKAVVGILEDEITALIETFEKDLNRQWFGDGTGQLCKTSADAATATTTVTVDTPGTDYIVEGMYVVIGSNSAVEVTGVTDENTFTISSALTWSAGDVVKKENANEMMGLKGIVDDGDFVATFQTITRSTNPWACANVDDVAEALTEADMITQYLNAKKYASKISPDGKGLNKIICFMGQTLFEKYGSLLTSTKRTRDLKEVLSGGWKGLDFMGGDCAVLLDYDCPEGFVLFVDMTSLIRAEMTKPFKWLDGEGERGILTRSSSNRTIWEATMKYYANLVCTKPRANSVLRNKTA